MGELAGGWSVAVAVGIAVAVAVVEAVAVVVAVTVFFFFSSTIRKSPDIQWPPLYWHIGIFVNLRIGCL